MSIDPSDRLWHILREAQYLTRTFQRLQNVEQLETDEHLSRSVVRSIEIIGEATKSLPEALRSQHDDIPWREIARMRDNLIHRYFGVRYDIVWQVMQQDIPLLNQRIPQILADVHRDSYLEYKQNIASRQPASAFSVYLDSEIDKAIATAILQEYDSKYRQTAIAKVKDILSQSDFARSLDREQENRLESYIQNTIKEAVSNLSSTPNRPNLELRDES